MAIALEQLSRLEPIVRRPAAPIAERPQPDVSHELFTADEQRQFWNEDSEAGATICRILCTMFAWALIIAIVVLWWTIRVVRF